MEFSDFPSSYRKRGLDKFVTRPVTRLFDPYSQSYPLLPVVTRGIPKSGNIMKKSLFFAVCGFE